VSIDSVLWLAGTAGEAVVLGLLLYRRIWRNFPVFFAYSIWTLIAGAAGYVLFSVFSSHAPAYVEAYLIDMVVDSALLFGVLVEIGWSILRPLRPSLSRRTLLVIAGLILALGAAVWPFATVTAPPGTHSNIASLMHLQQAFYVLRVLVFLALAAFSQFLSIGWRDRELQIVTGFGITSLVSLAVAMLHAYPSMRGQYRHLNELVIASYLCSLLYWTISFSQKEEQRRAFSPQMQSMLLAVAGAARSTRIALSQPVSTGRKDD
jgi:hypothetical protein